MTTQTISGIIARNYNYSSIDGKVIVVKPNVADDYIARCALSGANATEFRAENADIFAMPETQSQLMILRIPHNPIAFLPESYKNLVELDIKHTSISGGIHNLPNLIYLNISNTAVISLMKLPKLGVLKANYCEQSLTLPVDSPELEVLHIQSTTIKKGIPLYERLVSLRCNYVHLGLMSTSAWINCNTSMRIEVSY